MNEVIVQATGPLFQGVAPRVIQAFLDEAVEVVAQEGENMVRVRLGAVLKNPTGFYESRIQTERVGTDMAVTDGGVVYGPWLEGVGSRNQTTRFKGYRTFREVTQALDAEAGGIADALFARKYLRRLNG